MGSLSVLATDAAVAVGSASLVAFHNLHCSSVLAVPTPGPSCNSPFWLVVRPQRLHMHVMLPPFCIPLWQFVPMMSLHSTQKICRVTCSYSGVALTKFRDWSGVMNGGCTSWIRPSFNKMEVNWRGNFTCLVALLVALKAVHELCMNSLHTIGMCMYQSLSSSCTLDTISDQIKVTLNAIPAGFLSGLRNLLMFVSAFCW